MSEVYEKLKDITEKLSGATVSRPSGQLAGHAGGLPFEVLVHDELVRAFPAGCAFRHFEALNHVLAIGSAGDETWSPDEEWTFGPGPVDFLVRRGRTAMSKWRLGEQFLEKQNDTAESIIFSDSAKCFESDVVTLVDVKSQTTSRPTQPPNIISAKKICQLAQKVLDSRVDPTFDFFYVGVRFEEYNNEGEKMLRAIQWDIVDLFKINPQKIYINWAAALQIQFHPAQVDQSYNGSKVSWFREFLEKYAESLESRVGKMQAEVLSVREVLNRETK